MKNISFLILLFLSLPTFGQELLIISRGCNYAGDDHRFEEEEIYGFNSDIEAENAVKRIMSFTGLSSNFTIKAANVENAEAVVDGEKRLILYSQTFMQRANNISDWAAISILAHEIGHHLNGHTLSKEGSRKQTELEADKFSGFVLFKMSASLEQAQSAVQSLTKDNINGKTHPPKSARLAAIANGWVEAKQQGGGKIIEPIQPTNVESEAEIKKAISDGNTFCMKGDFTNAFPLLYKYKDSPYFNAAGQSNLGYMYSNGKGVTKDYYEAVKWYRKSAEQGNAGGQKNLGGMYSDGKGVTQDYYEAVKWYRKSAEQGNANGQSDLGNMYEYGRGVTQDYYEAVKWYRKSAEQGNAYGQAYLGDMYENGFGVTKDLNEAIRLYRLAAKQGNDFAQKALTRLGQTW